MCQNMLRQNKRKRWNMRRKYWIILIAVCLVCISGLLLACTDSDKNKEKDEG